MMKDLLPRLSMLLIAAALSRPAFAQERSQNPTPQPAATKADNSAINARDESGATLTPRDQPNNATDIKVEADVRSAIVGDKTLSTLAHNVKIVTANGTVTLRGPVRTVAEKERVAKLAMNTSGVARVENLIDVNRK